MSRKYPLRFSDKRSGAPLTLTTPSTQPSKVDLRHLFKFPVYDQGELGSCTANALCAALQTILPSQAFQPSRMFLYTNELLLDGDTALVDQGSTLESGCAVLSKFGVCSEDTWPYEPKIDFKKPSPEAYKEALSHRFFLFRHIAPSQYKAILAQGYVFTIGIMVYPSFETPEVARSGVVPLPKSTESCLGGHAVTVCGYDDSLACYLLRNSWSDRWGQQGYFWLPYEYLENTQLANDAICLLPPRKVLTRTSEVRPSHAGPRFKLLHF